MERGGRRERGEEGEEALCGLARCSLTVYLVNELSAVCVLCGENHGPELGVLAVDEVASLTLEEGVIIAHLSEREGERE